MATKIPRSTTRRGPAKRAARPSPRRTKRKAAAAVAAGRTRARPAESGSPGARAQRPGVGDEAVVAGSGRGWTEWFALLDTAGAAQWKHKEIAAYLYDELECPGWWNQMVAVGYEQARGLRAKNESASGFQVSCNRTIEVPVRAAFAAWTNGSERRRWLGPGAVTVRKATLDKTMRLTWLDGVSSVEVYFTSKPGGRSQVSVQHRKLASAREVASMRGFWSGALERLRQRLEA
jgi:uncharacterized protein YndB with AHSA1/START domain